MSEILVRPGFSFDGLQGMRWPLSGLGALGAKPWKSAVEVWHEVPTYQKGWTGNPGLWGKKAASEAERFLGWLRGNGALVPGQEATIPRAGYFSGKDFLRDSYAFGPIPTLAESPLDGGGVFGVMSMDDTLLVVVRAQVQGVRQWLVRMRVVPGGASWRVRTWQVGSDVPDFVSGYAPKVRGRSATEDSVPHSYISELVEDFKTIITRTPVLQDGVPYVLDLPMTEAVKAMSRAAWLGTKNPSSKTWSTTGEGLFVLTANTVAGVTTFVAAMRCRVDPKGSKERGQWIVVLKGRPGDATTKVTLKAVTL